MSLAVPVVQPDCTHATRRTLWNGMLSRCQDCGLVASASVPAFEYAEDYFVEGGTGYDFDSPFARAFDAERFECELSSLESRGYGGSVLDVGCAVGTFLSHAKARGWEIAGVELAAFARGEASRRLGIEVRDSLDSLPAGCRYDVVTLHHVLEHVHDPIGFLAREIAPRVGRLLLVEVPNFASLAAQSEGPRWKDLRPEQHVHHFEPATLQAIVAAAGFEVLRIDTLVEPLWSLRAALRTLRTLRALAGPRAFEAAELPSPAAVAASLSSPDWQPPQGLRRAVLGASRLAMLPLIRWIERTLHAERLVLEAQPPRAGS